MYQKYCELIKASPQITCLLGHFLLLAANHVRHVRAFISKGNE
uniref:Uncharacterized protein n=1 Tax=Arundo donax TaxID=35708 RepID=A0A0A8Y1H5_ARUDO